MDAKTIWLYIVVMAGVTYLIRMLPLAVLPCLIFLLNGLFLRHWLLVFFSVLFAAAHIAITWQNTRAP